MAEIRTTAIGLMLFVGIIAPAGMHAVAQTERAGSQASGPAPATDTADEIAAVTSDAPVHVLIIGDSISMDGGYYPGLVSRLGNGYRVRHNPGNGGDSANVLARLDDWLSGDSPAIIHFNCGLHDLKFDRSTNKFQQAPEAYERNLREIVRMLKARTRARLVFALTTPVNEEWHRANKPFDRREADVERYNEIARAVMAENEIPIDDLHAIIAAAGPDTCLRTDGVHMNDKGNALLAEAVASIIVRLAKDGGRKPHGAGGPLRVQPTNSRYFADRSGKAVYLTGSHVWTSIQDWGTTDPPPVMDFDDFLDFLEQHGHNFTRLWAWEHAFGAAWSKDPFFIQPLAYARTGPGLALDGKPKFDLDRYDDAYFARLRKRVAGAAERGIYVGVMLFQGFSVESKGMGGNPYRGHPFHRDNNINGIDGDADGNQEAVEIHTLSNPAVKAIQEAYVRKVIDTLNDLDNVIWEIGNECHRGSKDWQYHLIRLIKEYEAEKPKQHLIWMTAAWEPGDNSRNNLDLFESLADAVSPNSVSLDYKNNPPAADGRRVILVDTDHLWGIGGNGSWVWRSFTRGLNPIFMDPKHGIPGWPRVPKPDDPDLLAARRAMGHTRSFAQRIDLARTSPQAADVSKPSTTRYCLSESGVVYVIYQPDRGGFSVDLPAGRYAYEWFDPIRGEVKERGEILVQGGGHKFQAPFDHEAVLYLERNQSPSHP